MADVVLKKQLKWTWLNMWLVMAFLLVRNVYRIAEFGGDNRPPINDTQDDGLHCITLCSTSVETLSSPFAFEKSPRLMFTDSEEIWRFFKGVQ